MFRQAIKKGLDNMSKIDQIYQEIVRQWQEHIVQIGNHHHLRLTQRKLKVVEV